MLDTRAKPARRRSRLRGAAYFFGWCGLVLVTLWGVAALYLDLRVAALRVPLAVAYGLGMTAVWLCVRRPFKGRPPLLVPKPLACSSRLPPPERVWVLFLLAAAVAWLAGCAQPISAVKTPPRTAYQQSTANALGSSTCSSQTRLVLHRFDLTERFKNCLLYTSPSPRDS